ncbi:hypothetical protein [Paenibacillus sp. JMULE4]|uniref:hypothetical protein n=1 Tax=Paenibacillus sp. JMULE4 TaxID=2518342 RepID=UPI001C2DD899|nr:hypothetical protein [Paenibacillus sp. JMULE4]
MTSKLQEQLEKKEIILGGCCIVIPTPTHHCNTCKKNYGGCYFEIPTYVKELYFYIGGFFGTSHQVYLNTKTSGLVLKYVSSEGYGVDIKNDCDGIDILRVPVHDQWIEFNDDMLHCYFIDWKPRYVDKNVLDGTQWGLEVTFENGTTIKRHGSNDYPPHWNKLIKLFQKYGLPAIE